jgi:hypothetical protein
VALAEEFDGLTVHVYQIGEQRYPQLAIGVPDGRTRPAMWMILAPNQNVILSQFHGDQEARAAIYFMDSMVEQINAVIDHLTQQKPQGDDEQNKPY